METAFVCIITQENEKVYFFWRQKEKISAASFEKTNTPQPDKLKGALQNASIPKRPFFSFGHATARMRDLFGGEKGTFNIALFFSSAFFFTSKNLPQPMLVQVFLQTEADVLLLSAAITPAKTIRSAYRRCCKRVSLPDQKDNLSGNFVYSPHLPDHGNAAFARLSSVWPEAYKVTSGHSSRWPSNTCSFLFRMDGSSSPSPVFVAVSRAVLSG